MLKSRLFRLLPALLLAGATTLADKDDDKHDYKKSPATREASKDRDGDCDSDEHHDRGPRSIQLSPLGSYASGIFDEGGAEIVAHDPIHQNLFVINALNATVDVLNIQNPANPTLVHTIDVTPYGAVANSVAVKNGIVAVAVQADPKTDPGSVAFFDVDFNYLNHVQVGAQPDMVTFTPDGRYVLTADEGEPNDDYTVDPEGSVSVIRLAKDLTRLRQSNVKTANFRRYNNKTLDASVRIFGPGASVAQDLEPEYITVSEDSRTAWVTLQENNAIAEIDIRSAKVSKIRGLGFKDHSAVQTEIETYSISADEMPSIGTTVAGQNIALGGFSGLHFSGIDSTTGNLRFVAITDRGPNAESTAAGRPFILPDFSPEIVRLELNRETRAITITERISIQRAPGDYITGLPNTSISEGNGSTPYNDELPIDLLGNILPLDPLGGDTEAVFEEADGSFWSCDEYRPSIYHFDAAGVLIKRYVPVGTAAAAGQPAGFFGEEVLPATLAQRRQNRGFEALAAYNGKVYAFVQSPLRNPATLSNGSLNAMKNVRVVELDPATDEVRQFIYVMDNPNDPTLGSRPDKIGDAVSLGNGDFLVVERDDDTIYNTTESSQIEKRIYRFNLNGATELSDALEADFATAAGKTVDQASIDELTSNGINPILKTLYVDLNQAGYNMVEKVEGLTVIDPWTIALINDNDFNVANITVDETGKFTLNSGYIPEPTVLAIISVHANGLDASNKDDAINIRPWPVKGMYMPDAIASYKVGRYHFLVTANEGDTRDYDGFSEETAIGDLPLDPAFFPNAEPLQNKANLGNLLTSVTMGQNPDTGLYEELYSIGARSFSIWTQNGTQVYDSGDDIEWITAAASPDFFNTSNTKNTFDDRSDDKGPEPEGIALGQIGRDTYAFIGLERIGGVVVYNITSPTQPRFIQYINSRDFTADVESPEAGDLGPEGLIFVPAEESPNGTPLLVVSNEISGTTRIYQISRVD
ncbi:MAG: hypothetical protein RI897_3165 [Verrucomicrobiota bacterium]|jgi:uncharacterized protein (UPF0297 family)